MDDFLIGAGTVGILGVIISSVYTHDITNSAWEKEAIDLGYGEMVLINKFDKTAEFQWKVLEDVEKEE